MEIFKIKNLSFKYPLNSSDALNNISLDIKSGEFITVVGRSGCGKTTFLRLLKPYLSPYGEVRGDIIYDGISMSDLDERRKATEIGFVMQNPENQTVTDKVWHELAFGLENMGYSSGEIKSRVAEMVSFFGMETWFYKNVSELSGGQLQILNLASVMVMQPKVLILDEPTSQLDPVSAQEFLKMLERINTELGVTVIISEHRTQDLFSMSDRIIVMEDGMITGDASPLKIGEIIRNNNSDMFYSLPAVTRLYYTLGEEGSSPVTIRDAKKWIGEYIQDNNIIPAFVPYRTYKTNSTEAAIRLKDVWFRYDKDGEDILKGLDLKVYKGEIFALVGGNGVGKTTSLNLMAGLNTPYRGKVEIFGENISKIKNLYNGTLGMMVQNPQSSFAKNTVMEELTEVASACDITKEQQTEQIGKIASLCKIDTLFERHPYDLSGGEQQRLALCKILLRLPDIILLDEPTKGMDAHFKEEFAEILDDVRNMGKTIVMITHDIEFCAMHCDRCAMLFDGNITSCDNPGKFFAGKSFYTTCINRAVRDILPEAVSVEDVVLSFGKNTDKPTLKNKKDISFKKASDNNLKNEVNNDLKATKEKISKSTLLSVIMILFAIPLTIYTGVYFLDDRKYYFISLLIIFEIMLPFILIFEDRKPRARELVIISVLCAIAVAGRTAFFMIPQFKPVIAIVIISGVCLGGEIGFLVGAVTGFVSNFYFGQGPWTPWQMFAFGLIGFLGGVIFKKKTMSQSKLSLCIFGVLATIIIYGGIMNPSSVIQSQTEPTFDMLIAAYISGFPLDVVHALSTGIFLMILSEPMIKKLQRVKLKYGLI